MRRLLLAAIAGPLAFSTAARGQATVTWTGADSTWSQPDPNSFNAPYASGDTAVFAGAGTGGTVTISGTVTPGQVNVTSGDYTFSGGLGGSTATSGLAKSGAGTLTLIGSANTYQGTTAVSGGSLVLLKGDNVIAVPGNLVIEDAVVRFGIGNNFNNQIASTAAVTMSGSTAGFNGIGFADINLSNFNLSQTLASFTVTGGVVNTTNVNSATGLTITGAGSITGGAGNTDFWYGSGGLGSFGSLSLVGMTGTTHPVAAAPNTFRLFGNNATRQTQVTIGSGGLSLDGSNILLGLGTEAGRLGSRIVLNGNVTTSGSSASSIMPPSGDSGLFGTREVALSSTAGSVTRTFTTGGGGADLTVSVAITNGSATTAGITKAGAGTLTLSAANTYNGTTSINAGTLALTGNGSLPTDGAANPAPSGATFDISGITASGLTIGSLAGSAGSVVTLGSKSLTVGNAASTAFAGAIEGIGGLTKNGSGTLTLSGTNTYTGGTQINAGGLAWLSPAAQPASGTTTVANGAGLSLGVGSGLFSVADFESLYANTLPNVSLGAAALAGIDTTAGDVSIATALGGTRGVAKTGSGTLTLSGSNTYTGDTQIDGGVLALGSGTLPGAISGSGSLTKQGAGTLTLSSNNTYTGGTQINAGTLALTGNGSLATTVAVNVAASSATFDISGITASGLTIGSLAGSAGSVVTLGSKSLTVGNAASTAFAGAIGGTGGVTKNGSGTLTLSGTNTFSGASRVNGGTLLLDYSAGGNTADPLGTSAITLDMGTLVLKGRSSSATTETISAINFNANNGVVNTLKLDANGGSGIALTTSTFGFSATATDSSNFNLIDLSSSGANSLTVSGLAASAAVRNGVLMQQRTPNGTSTARANLIVRDSGGYGFATLSGGTSGTLGRLTAGSTLDATDSNAATNYRLTATGTLTRTAPLNYSTLTIDSTAGPVTLAMGANSLLASPGDGRAILVTGPNDIGITGSSTLGGPGGWIHNYSTGTLTFGLNAPNTSSSFLIGGPGLTVWTGVTAMNDLVLYVAGGIVRPTTAQSWVSGGLGSFGSVWITSGGVLEVGADLNGSTAGDLSNAVGTSGSQIRFYGDSGVSAFGGNRVVGFRTGGTEGLQSLTWGASGFLTQADGTTDGNFILKLSSNRSDSLVTVQNAIALGSLVRTIEVADGSAAVDAEISGALTGAGGLTKAGAGTLTLSAANTYNGTTTISAGTLALAAVGSFASSPTITVESGGGLSLTSKTELGFTFGAGQTLAGSGSVALPTSGPGVSLLGTLAPGGGAVGTLAFTGAGTLDIGSATALQFGLGTTGASDLVTLSTGTLAIGTGLLSFSDFAFTDLAGFGPGTYTLFSAGSITGSLGTTSGTVGGFDSTLAVSGGTDLQLVVVPEPGAVLLAGLGIAAAAAAALLRRRRLQAA